MTRAHPGCQAAARLLPVAFPFRIPALRHALRRRQDLLGSPTHATSEIGAFGIQPQHDKNRTPTHQRRRPLRVSAGCRFKRACISSSTGCSLVPGGGNTRFKPRPIKSFFRGLSEEHFSPANIIKWRPQVTCTMRPSKSPADTVSTRQSPNSLLCFLMPSTSLLTRIGT